MASPTPTQPTPPPDPPTHPVDCGVGLLLLDVVTRHEQVEALKALPPQQAGQHKRDRRLCGRGAHRHWQPRRRRRVHQRDDAGPRGRLPAADDVLVLLRLPVLDHVDQQRLLRLVGGRPVAAARQRAGGGPSVLPKIPAHLWFAATHLVRKWQWGRWDRWGQEVPKQHGEGIRCCTAPGGLAHIPCFAAGRRRPRSTQARRRHRRRRRRPSQGGSAH